MACKRSIILQRIESVIKHKTDWEQDKKDGYIYRIKGGTIDVLDLLSIFTTARHVLLSELMEKLVVDDIKKEDIMDTITNIIMEFDRKEADKVDPMGGGEQ